MMSRVLRLLGLRRARLSSTHLTPKYEERRRREIAKAQKMFGEAGR